MQDIQKNQQGCGSRATKEKSGYRRHNDNMRWYQLIIFEIVIHFSPPLKNNTYSNTKKKTTANTQTMICTKISA